MADNKVPKDATLNLSGSESNFFVMNNEDAPVPELIPDWDNPLNAHKFYVPASDSDAIIAKASDLKSICCITLFSTGLYKLDWKETSLVSKTLTKDQLETYCAKASIYCAETMSYASNGIKIFYAGFAAVFLISMALVSVALIFDVLWAAFIGVFILVFGTGYLYDLLNNRAKRIYLQLKSFIENNDDLRAKRIGITPGPYGAYIEFCIKR